MGKAIRKTFKSIISCCRADYSGDMGALARKISQNSAELRLQDLDEDFTEEEMKEAFKVFDRNGDGTIRSADCRSAMANLGIDLDYDREAKLMKHDRINFDQFAEALQK